MTRHRVTTCKPSRDHIREELRLGLVQKVRQDIQFSGSGYYIWSERNAMDTVNIMNETFGSTRRQDYGAEEVFFVDFG